MGALESCFLVSLSEEHGFKKWKRLGLKLKQDNEKVVIGLCPIGEERVRHSGVGSACGSLEMVGIFLRL